MNKQEMTRKIKSMRLPMFIIACISYMLVTFYRLTPSIMGATLRADLSLSPSAFAWIGTVYMWVYAICQAPVGTLLDRIGTRKGVTTLLISTAIGAIIFAKAQGLGMLLVGRGLIALSVSGFMVGGAKVCSQWYTTREYSTYYPIFMAMGAIGGIFATTPLRWMMDAFGWRNAIIGIAFIGIICGVLSLIFMRDSPEKVGMLSADEAMGTEEEIQTVKAKREAAATVAKVPMKVVLVMPILWICGFVALGPNSSGQCLQSLWEGIYLKDVYGYNSATISNILFFSSVGLVVGSLCASAVIKKLKLSRSLVLSTCLFMIAWLYMTINVASMSVTELSIVNFILGTCQMWTITTNFTLIREVMPTDRLGTAMGFLNSFIWIFGAGLFQKIWGWIIAAISGGIQPYPVEAFRTCMWLQVVIIALTVSATLVVFTMAKRGKLVSKNML